MSSRGSDDASSVTSGGPGSEAGSVTGDAGAGHSHDQSELLDHGQDIYTAMFGVVYTLSKEKYDRSNKFAVAKILLDFLQLLILIVNPTFGWNIDEKLWLWKVVSYLQFKNPIISKGYGFYVAILYITVATLVIGLVLCVWVGWCFKNDRFPYIWPIKCLRLVVSVFFVVFYIASLSVFLLALQCNYFTKDKDVRWQLEHFNKECLAFPHMIHAGVSFLAGLAFIFVAVVMTVADFELNPVTPALLAAPSSVVELRAIVMKTIMCVSSALLDGKTKVQAVIIVGAAWLLLWSYLRWMPYYNKWINHVRTALYGGLSWAGLLLLILVFKKNSNATEFQKSITTALLAGLLPMIVLCFGVSYIRYELFYRGGIKAFREMDPSKRLKDIYRFSEEQQVEVLSRCCRKWVDEDTLDPESVKLAETIIKAGLATFSNNAIITILYSNFLIEVQALYQNGHTQLQAAKKMSPTISQKFVIFIREQEHRQKAQTRSSGESAVDLVSYVEFQRNYRLLIRSHKAAMYATRGFWKQLLHHDVSFMQLTKAFTSIESNEVRAEKTYKMVLERYPQSAKLLRSYGRFLEDVKHDPWGAARYFSEAEKVEDEADTNQNEGAFAIGDESADGASKIDEKNNALVLINASGIIQMANKLALKMFGYKKGELEGKNVSMLMPNPFSQRHNSYLRNYITSGKAKILNTVRDVVGMHKERYVFPIKISVSKVSGSGSDSTFLGVILPVAENPDVVCCWVMPTGVVLCADERFTDWFAKSHHDIVGRSFISLAVEQDRLAQLLEDAGNAAEDDFINGAIKMNNVKILHKYLDGIDCNIRCTLGGTDSQRLYMMEINRLDTSSSANNLMVTDQKGQITFITSTTAHMLGYQTKDMVGKLGIQNLMNPPFSLLHQKWIAELPPKIPPNSCRNSATVVAVTSNGASLPVRMNISSREEANGTVFLVNMSKSSFEEGLDLRRIAANIDLEGNIKEITMTPAALFGFKPSVLVGLELDSFIETLHNLVKSEGLPLSTVLQAMIAKVADRPGICWRVGVRTPTIHHDQTGDSAATSSTHHAIGSKVRPAVMHLQVTESNDELELCMDVFRADSLTGIIEVDRDGRICKAGCCPLHQAGPIFGLASHSMMRMPLGSFIDLGGQSVQDALLLDGPSKGVMKSGTSTGMKLGPVKKLYGRHVDGEPLVINVQAVPKDASRRRIVVKVNPVQLSTGSAAALKRSIIADESAVDGSKGGSTKGPGSMMDIPASLIAPAPQTSRSAAFLTTDDGQAMPTAEVPNTQQLSRVQQWVMASTEELPPPIAKLQLGTAFNSTAITIQPDEKGLALDAVVADDNGSQYSADASQISGSQAAGAAVEQATDYRKGKRYKKLKRLLAGKSTQAAVDRFHVQTYAVLAGMVLVHLSCFVIFTTFINSLQQYVYEMDSSGRANDMLHRIAINSIILRQLHKGHEAPGIYTISQIPHFVNLMRQRIDEFEMQHRGIYLGFKKLRRLKNGKNYPLAHLWQDPYLTTTNYIDVKSPFVENQTTTLWQMGNQFIMAAREVMSNHDRMAGSSTVYNTSTVDLEYNRHWHYVVGNAPSVLFNSYKEILEALLARAMAQVNQVNTVNIALLVVEGCVVGAIAMAYMWFLVKQVINMRYSLFSAFLIVPAGFLRGLASKQVHIDDDDNEDSDSDDGDAGNFEANTQANKETTAIANGDPSKTSFIQLDYKMKPNELAMQSPNSQSKVVTIFGGIYTSIVTFISGSTPGSSGKRKLRRDAKDMAYILAPFALWSTLVLIIYSVSYSNMEKNVSGLIDNSIADTVDFRVTRVIFYAIQFCASESPAEINDTRPWVLTTSNKLEYAYNALMYGTGSDYTDSRYKSSGTTFNKGSPVKFFFRAKGKCWRLDQASCFNSSSEYYEISRNGIDAMMLRMIEESMLLSQDIPADVNVSNPRLSYIWKVGNYDLHEGMQQAASRYTQRTLASFQSVLDLHIALFVLSWIMVFTFIIFIFKPFLRRINAESRRVAELLSQLPSDMDVEALVEQALGRKKANPKDGDDIDNIKKAATGSLGAKATLLDSGKMIAVDGATGPKRRASFSIPAGLDADNDQENLLQRSQRDDMSEAESSAVYE